MSHTIDLLNEVLEFLEPYVDVVDGSYGEPRPNKAMSLTTAIEQEIERLTSCEPKKKMGFAAAVREYGDNWIHSGFCWNGESYRGMSPATIIAMQDSRGPDDNDAHRMRCCRQWGRDWAVT